MSSSEVAAAGGDDEPQETVEETPEDEALIFDTCEYLVLF